MLGFNLPTLFFSSERLVPAFCAASAPLLSRARKPSRFLARSVSFLEVEPISLVSLFICALRDLTAASCALILSLLLALSNLGDSALLILPAPLLPLRFAPDISNLRPLSLSSMIRRTLVNSLLSCPWFMLIPSSRLMSDAIIVSPYKKGHATDYWCLTNLAVCMAFI